MGTTKQTNKTKQQTLKPSSDSDKLVQDYFDRINAPREETVPALRPASLPVLASETLTGWMEAYRHGDKLAIATINKDLSMQRIVDEGAVVQISRYRKHEPAILNDLLMRMLLDFNKGFHERIQMTGDMIREIAAEIQVNYWHLSLEDISVFLAKVKRGDYSTLITALDTNKMLTWLKQYDIDRLALIMAKRKSEENAYVPLKEIPRSSDIDKARLSDAMAFGDIAKGAKEKAVTNDKNVKKKVQSKKS
jgi:hypothetical protein